VIGVEDRCRPLAPLFRGQAAIAGNIDPVADLRDRGRVLQMAVAVDHQPRIVILQQWRVQALAQPLPQLRDADIPGNVLVEMFRAQAEIIEAARHRPPGMVAKQDQRRLSCRIAAFERYRIARLQQGIVMHHPLARHARNHG